MKVDQILQTACERVLKIKIPSFVTKTYHSTPKEAEMDQTFGPCAVREEVSAIQRPCFCFLGAFNSGKTFLIRYLLKSDILLTDFEPTTATITVLRHPSQKPANWDQADTVFALKPGADPRSLNDSDILLHGSYSVLAKLTTYSGDENQGPVVVFIESDFLLDKVVMDCPGVGIMAEADGPQDESKALAFVDTLLRSGPNKTMKQSMRERELQALAMSCCDGFLLLSSAGEGAFSDSNVAHVLNKLADNVGRFPMKMPHGNLLLVGSRANPQAELRNQEEVLAKLRGAIVKQFERLAPSQREKLVPEALMHRIVLFYTLDETQRNNEIAKLVRSLLRHDPTMDSHTARTEAEEQFAEESGDMERTQAFNAAFSTMVEQMHLRMEDYRSQLAKDKLILSRDHFRKNRDTALGRANAKREMEILSERYKRELGARETAWQALLQRAHGLLSDAREQAVVAFTKEYSYWEDQDNVETFLKATYESKEQAKDFSPDEIQKRLNAALQHAIVTQIGKVENSMLEDLKTFDKAFLQRREGEFKNIDGLVSSAEDDYGFSRLASVSAFSTFSAITMGIAGGTTLLATAGSTLAAAAIVKLMVFTVGIAGVFGGGAAVAGLLLGIPVAGWVALGLLGIGAAIRALWTSWQTTMAKAIVKSAKARRKETLSTAENAARSLVDAAKSVLLDSLTGTKSVIDGHIKQIHDVATGAVTADDLQSAGHFYGQHVDLLEETLSQFGYEE